MNTLIPTSVLKWLGYKETQKHEIIGKRSMLRLIDPNLNGVPDVHGFKTFDSESANARFRIWEPYCAVGMRYQLEWPDHFPSRPAALIFMVDSTDVPIWRTVRDEIRKIISEERLRSCPIALFLTKVDIETPHRQHLTVERIQEDLRLVNLRDQGLHTGVWRTTITRAESFNPGLDWLTERIRLAGSS